MLLAFSVVCSLAMQLLEVEDVVDETPVVAAWFAFSIILLQLGANALIFASYHKDTYKCVLKHDPALYDPTNNQR